MNYDLTLVLATTSQANMIRTLDYIGRQSIAGIKCELVIVQESNKGFDHFNLDIKIPINHLSVVRQKRHYDYGAAAHDAGVLAAKGEYIAFWDDDNLYYQHAMSTLYATANGFDMGIVRTDHHGLIIPVSNEIKAGYIDTMCICVRKSLAIREKWANNGGRYSDYRWIKSLLAYEPMINYSKIIIGHHL